MEQLAAGRCRPRHAGPLPARPREGAGERAQHDREAARREGHHRDLRRRPGHPLVPHAGGDRAELLPRVGRAGRRVHRHVAVRPAVRPAAVEARVRLSTLLPTRQAARPTSSYSILVWQSGQGPIAKTFKVLVQAPLIFYTALHLAGPDLTPGTFRDGLFRFPSGRPTHPTVLHLSWGHHDIWPGADLFGSDDATHDLVGPRPARGSTRSATRARACGSTPRTASATSRTSGPTATSVSTRRRGHARDHAADDQPPSSRRRPCPTYRRRPTETQPSPSDVAADHTCRVADRDAEVRELAGDDRARADHDVLPDRRRRAARSSRGRATRRRRSTRDAAPRTAGPVGTYTSS